MPHGKLNAGLLVQNLSDQGIEAIFFLGPSVPGRPFFQEALKRHWKPFLFIPGPLADRSVFDAPAGFQTRIFLSFPTLPTDQDPGSVRTYRKLAEAHGLPAQHLTTQLTALASAKILVEGLKRAGRDLSREKLLEELEGLYAFHTGFTPSITYGPNRRIGATGAYIVSIDRSATVSPIRGWIDPS